MQGKGGLVLKEKLEDYSPWVGMVYAISVLLLLVFVNTCVDRLPAVAVDGNSVKTFEPPDHLANPGPTSPEDMAMLAECSAEVKERLRMMARRGAVAARRLTNAERNRH